jgi:hypothetical protein
MKTNMAYFNHEGMPTLRIETNDPKIGTGYLHPFRAYSFQVSGTPDGQGDLGSTSVMDLPSLAKSLEEGNAKIILRELAQAAVANFLGVIPRDAAIECGRIDNFESFDKWLEEVYVGLMRTNCKFGHWN